MEEHVHKQLRILPAVHRILSDERITNHNLEEWSREQLTNRIGSMLEQLRNEIRASRIEINSEDDVFTYLMNRLYTEQQMKLQHVINASGVVLHTNLGRARLGQHVIEHMRQVAAHYSNLEYNLIEGKRGSRHDHVEQLICQLTGAEAAMIVNNNAAAVFLVLRTFAQDREVIVSRGQLVEIGGSFRVSEIMAESGATLVEVGTTNKTKLSDYEKHITDSTAVLLKVHTSNFRIIGFTAEVKTTELVELAQKHDLLLYEDLGSGVFYDLREHGIGDEPTVSEVIASGVDLVSFSGDKLLGGPQAGIIAGKKKWIEHLKENQLMRILRADKITIAGLEATLSMYRNPERAIREIPTLRDILVKPEMIKEQVEIFLQRLQERGILSDWEQQILEEMSEVGGGTLPTLKLPTYVIAFRHQDKGAHILERALRLSKPAVITRVANERVLLDFRTITPEDSEQLFAVFEALQLE